jgi:hypothetical protein
MQTIFPSCQQQVCDTWHQTCDLLLLHPSINLLWSVNVVSDVDDDGGLP